MKHVLVEYVWQVSVNKALVLEQRIALVLQPKPRWLPEFVWRRVVARLIVIEEGSLSSPPTSTKETP